MKNHFPFTDYDFYAYLASGSLFLAVADYVFNDAPFLARSDWTFAQIALAIAFSYVMGHLIASAAQVVLQTVVVSKLITKPMNLQLGFKEPNWFEIVLGGLVGRYYGPLPLKTRTTILADAADGLGCTAADIDDGEDVFLQGFRKSFGKDKVRERIDDFRNQYGFCRNISFLALVSAVLLSWKAWADHNIQDLWLALASFLIFLGMFVRFVKFLATFQAEVIRVNGA